MNADLVALLELQAKHKVVLDIEEVLASLEPQFAELDEVVNHAQEQLDTQRVRAQEADDRRAELESKIEGYRVMQERKRQKLEWVRGAKEASTLMAELDLARTVLAREEAEWIRSADKVQDMQRQVAESEAALQEIEEGQAPERQELEGRRSDLDERLAAAVDERDQVAEGVQPKLRDQFRRILRGRARLALYPLKSGACGHCYTQVPLHRQQKIRNGDTIEACEACGVLVYQDDGSENES